MKRRNSVLALILLVLVIACSEPDSATKPASKHPDHQLSGDKRIESPGSQSEQSTKNALDLSIDKLPSAGINTDDSADFSAKPALPDLFEKTKKEKKASVSGGVLREEENPDYIESIRGAEVSVEVKIP